MKVVNFFLLTCLVLGFGCQKQEEEILDLDEMVQAEDEMDTKHLAGEPLSTPQEILIQEPKEDD